MEPGTHLLDGRDIFVNVMDVSLKRKPDAKLEVHDAYGYSGAHHRSRGLRLE